MYLTDHQIRARLEELNIVAPAPEAPFDADGQIQPCSIDLRLSPKYWRPRKRKQALDLTGSRLLEVNPRRFWDEHGLEAGETLTIKPGQMVLGRIYERVTMPSDCAGAIEGRSSFARMGLAVHLSGGFINPGWRGHMPLTLTNHGSTTLRLPPYLPICQLMLVPLEAVPDRIYGVPSLQSKYIDDDGGPSYWWRDKVISRLLETMGKRDLGRDMQERLLERIGVPPDDALERLEKLIATVPHNAFANVDEMLEIFAKKEDEQRMIDTIVRLGSRAVFPFLVAASLGSLFEKPYTWLHFVLWVLTILSAPVTYAGFKQSPSEYIGKKELAALERSRRANMNALSKS